MNKNAIDKSIWIIFICGIAPIVIPIINEWNSPHKNYWNLIDEIILLLIVASICLIVIFSSKIGNLIGKIPDSFVVIRNFLTRLFHFVIGPYGKGLLFILLSILVIFSQNFIIKIEGVLLLTWLYYLEWKGKRALITWTQNKGPKFQDGFDNGFTKWSVEAGTPELETNFGDPPPDLLLKQVGNASATPQTFLTLKEFSITRPSVIECEVYIEPNGIFNLVFGKTEQEESYFMARLDSRGTEFDALLFKSPGREWNFLARSDKYRTIPKTWHRIKLEIVSNKKVNFYKNDDLIVSKEMESSVYGKIGIMNEENDVHVDNFRLTEK